MIHELEAIRRERDVALAKLRDMTPPDDLDAAITEAKYAMQKRVGPNVTINHDRLMTLIVAARTLTK